MSRLGHYDVTALIGEGGMGQVYRATDTQLHRRPESWSADGQILVVADIANNQRDVHVIALGEETRTEGLIQTGFNEVNSQVSPDGCWIAYQSDESGQLEVYVRPFPNVDGRRSRISRDGGQSPVPSHSSSTVSKVKWRF